ncbi:hypothetical protein EVAR_20868_1 [Eumeta japonica]|uniref:Uncharacterized protein n=1 Tax=Eumeta variegata TaxID=151549 RepID=A0A4C1UVF2_EUMVA|nr:hypothetical protein EVAR_20868_1 [Eumeta japonica]
MGLEATLARRVNAYLHSISRWSGVRAGAEIPACELRNNKFSIGYNWPAACRIPVAAARRAGGRRASTTALISTAMAWTSLPLFYNCSSVEKIYERLDRKRRK